MSHTRPAPAAMPPPQPPLPPKSTVLTGPNGRISAPPTEENRYAAAPTRSPRNQAKNRVTLGDQRPVGSSARVPADLRGNVCIAAPHAIGADQDDRRLRSPAND